MTAQYELRFRQEAAKRDEALALLDEYRSELIDIAYSIAVEIATAVGRVTSTDVIEAMQVRGHNVDEAKDWRFVGGVFNRRKIWVPIGWERSGSHCRPVRVWALRAMQRTAA